MRTFQTLDAADANAVTGIITFTGSDTEVAMRREGEYVGFSASWGALEIALRPRARDLIRTLKQLQPNDGLGTTRQVGTGDSFLGLGLRGDGTLILRPTLISDATGYFCLNLALAPDAAGALRQWLDAGEARQPST